MRTVCLCASMVFTTLYAPVLAAQSPDGSGVGIVEPGEQSSSAWRHTRGRRGAPLLTPRAAYTRGFHTGLGWSGIMAGPQLVFWSVPFYRVAGKAFENADCAGGSCEAYLVLAGIGAAGSLTVAMIMSGWGLAASITGTYLVVNNRQGHLPGPGATRAYGAGMVKGMGIGLLATGALNIFWSGMFLGYDVEEALSDDKETGHTITLVMLGVGAAQVVGGGIMALVGHSKAASPLTRVSVTPVALPGGGALMLGGRF